MTRIKISQQVDVYEVDDEAVKGLDTLTIGIDSHWNRDDFIVLKIGKKSYTLVSNDLITAVQNAMNSGGI